MDQLMSFEARRAIALGYKNHWRFRVVGKGELKEAAYKDGWWFTPSGVPQIARERVAALRKAGVPIKGFVTAHEVPKLLPGETLRSQIILPDLLPVLRFIGHGVVLTFLYTFVFVLSAALVDPAFIVVLDDGTWLEVMTWYEPTTP